MVSGETDIVTDARLRRVMEVAMTTASAAALEPS
jgi:hypothetical protein